MDILYLSLSLSSSFLVTQWWIDVSSSTAAAAADAADAADAVAASLPPFLPLPCSLSQSLSLSSPPFLSVGRPLPPSLSLETLGGPERGFLCGPNPNPRLTSFAAIFTSARLASRVPRVLS